MMSLPENLSLQTGEAPERSRPTALPMQEMVSEYVRRYERRWWSAGADLPTFNTAYTLQEQRQNEKHLKQVVSTVLRAAQHPPRSAQERQAARQGLEEMVSGFARQCLGLEERHLQAMETYGFTEAGAEFARRARQFDPKLSPEDIFQASRNVWSMNFVQVLMGRPVEITPAVFAYSLLYPYTDNYLDDPWVAPETKRLFNQRFYRRLMGEQFAAANAQEQIISDLIGMIEGQFERRHYLQVYESLAAILKAQAASVSLIRPEASPYELDVLGQCFEKGGTSVLADGYLIAGELAPSEIDFLFYYGALTQLVDDLEDVGADLNAGLQTVFSMTARHWTLDAVTNRTLNFGAGLTQAMDCFATPGLEPLKELIQKGMDLLLLDVIGRGQRYYSREYLKAVEASYPFRFSTVAGQRMRLARRHQAVMALADGLFTEPAQAPAAEWRKRHPKFELRRISESLGFQISSLFR